MILEVSLREIYIFKQPEFIAFSPCSAKFIFTRSSLTRLKRSVQSSRSCGAPSLVTPHTPRSSCLLGAPGSVLALSSALPFGSIAFMPFSAKSIFTDNSLTRLKRSFQSPRSCETPFLATSTLLDQRPSLALLDRCLRSPWRFLDRWYLTYQPRSSSCS